MPSTAIVLIIGKCSEEERACAEFSKRMMAGLIR